MNGKHKRGHNTINATIKFTFNLDQILLNQQILHLLAILMLDASLL